MALPSQSDMRIEQMVTFVTDAQKLRYVCHSYYLENSVTLLESSSEAPPQRDKPKQEGWAQQLSGAPMSWSRVGTKHLAERKKAFSHLFCHLTPSTPNLSPPFRTVSQTEGLYHSTQDSFPDRSLLPELYICVTSNEYLMSLKKSTLALKTLCS